MAGNDQNDRHLPGPVTRVVGLVVVAVMVVAIISAAVAGEINLVFVLGGVAAGFTAGDVVDVIRQQRYWPTFPPVPAVTDPPGAQPKVSGTSSEHASRLAEQSALVPTVSDLGGPPQWAAAASFLYIGGTLVIPSGVTWSVSLASVAAGVILRLATPFAQRSQRRIADNRARRADRAAARMKGAVAERNVGNVLNSNDHFEYVLHAKTFGAGDVDHIVIGPCFAVIETKSGGGPVRLVDGRIAAGTKLFHPNLLSAVQRQAAQLSRSGGVPATPVLCIERASGRPRQFGGVWVCGSKQLGEVLEQLEHVCEEVAAGTVYNRCVRAHRKAFRRRTKAIAFQATPRGWRLRRLRQRINRQPLDPVPVKNRKPSKPGRNDAPTEP